MLAGRVKLKTFVASAGIAFGVVVGGGWLAWEAGAEDRAAERAELEAAEQAAQAAEEAASLQAQALAVAEAQRRAENPAVTPGTVSPSAVAEEDAPPGRPVDQVLFRYAGQPLGDKKKKDVTRGRPYKVNVYQDAGHSTANRAKVDLDRDDAWDEKITFEDGGAITRKVSPQDDENYSQVFHWSGSEWVAAE
jgi:hypothetical protein